MKTTNEELLEQIAVWQKTVIKLQEQKASLEKDILDIDIELNNLMLKYDKLCRELINENDNNIKKIINELGSNPNEDGTPSPNIQHWIEKKQIQLKNFYHLCKTKTKQLIKN